jgi:hypothetical protein
MIALATLVSGIAILLIRFRLCILDRTNQAYQLFFSDYYTVRHFVYLLV